MMIYFILPVMEKVEQLQTMSVADSINTTENKTVNCC